MRLSALAAVSVLGLAACEPAVPARPPGDVRPAPSAPSAEPDEEVGIGVFTSKRFGLRLPLPGGARYRIDDRSTGWLSVASADDASTLLVRLWRDDNRMNRDKCEERARSFRSLPGREGAELVEERRMDVPPGFDTKADVALVEGPGGALFGTILAFGGNGRKCFAYVYVTQASGAQSDVVIGGRLARMMESSLAALRFESDLELVPERETAKPE